MHEEARVRISRGEDRLIIIWPMLNDLVMVEEGSKLISPEKPLFFNQTRGGKREEREASDAKRMERRLLDRWMRVGGQVTEFGSVGQNEDKRGWFG